MSYSQVITNLCPTDDPGGHVGASVGLTANSSSDLLCVKEKSAGRSKGQQHGLSDDFGSQPAMRPALHHFGFKTANLDAMVDWYAKVLGMDQNHRSTTRHGSSTDAGWRTVWLSNDQANHRIVIMALPGLSDDVQKSRHRGLHHIAFEFPTLDDLLVTFRRLKHLGIEPVHSADHGPTTSLYYEDPDRNSIELFVDNFGDGRKSSEFMTTSASFATNPMGADVDPDQILAARAGGMSVAEIHERAYNGGFCSAAGFYRHYLHAAASRNTCM
jgi:catechol-2,3-dioxygenase